MKITIREKELLLRQRPLNGINQKNCLNSEISMPAKVTDNSKLLEKVQTKHLKTFWQNKKQKMSLRINNSQCLELQNQFLIKS